MDQLTIVRKKFLEDIETLKEYMVTGDFEGIGAYRDVCGRIKGLRAAVLHLDEQIDRIRLAEDG